MDPLFTKFDSEGSRQVQPEAIRKEVNALDENYILNVSEEDLVTALFPKFKWNIPTLDEPVLTGDREIERETRISEYGERCARKVRMSEITVQIPFSGDATFFRMRPPQTNWSPPKATIRSECLEIAFEVENSEAVPRFGQAEQGQEDGAEGSGRPRRHQALIRFRYFRSLMHSA
jgi:hypothetical protein